MITGHDIVCISSIEWSFLWQCHQEIALRLASAGNRVLYVENTGVRTPGIRDVSRVASRLRRWAKARPAKGIREVAPNLLICSPVVLPPFGCRWQRSLNRRYFLRSVVATARELQMRDPLIWSYLPTDTALDLIHLLRTEQSKIVYYGLADFSHLTNAVKRLEESERELLELCDVVFANCNELAYRFSRWNKNAHVFAPGVNLDSFPLTGGTETNETDPLAALSPGHPRIGYIGGLHRFVDYELIGAMAEAKPDWSWILVGAAQVDLKRIRDLPNVYLAGQQPHERLAGYLRSFDVCIVPYLNTPEMSTVVPTKINEYLAVGRPVVSTDLPAVCEFNEEHSILTTSRPSASDFLSAIEFLIERPGTAAEVERRRQIAALADWKLRLERMSSLVQEQLSSSNQTDENYSNASPYHKQESKI